MISSLSHYLNRTLLISIPSIFEDGRPRPYILRGIEAPGLWLESEDLADKLLQLDKKLPTAPVFIPFFHIAYLVGQRANRPQNPTTGRLPEVSKIEDKRPRRESRRKKQHTS